MVILGQFLDFDNFESCFSYRSIDVSQTNSKISVFERLSSCSKFYAHFASNTSFNNFPKTYSTKISKQNKISDKFLQKYFVPEIF